MNLKQIFGKIGMYSHIVNFWKVKTSLKLKYRLYFIISGSVVKLSCEGKCKLQEPDASKLTREYLIKSSSIQTSESASILLTQTALALEQAEREYKEALLAMIFLLEYKLNVLGNASEEARIWDLILEGRVLMQNTKKKKDDLEMLFSSVKSIVNMSAEVSYMTGADVVGSSAGDRLHKTEQLVSAEKTKREQAEIKLRDTQIKSIHVEGKYAEENAAELEQERLKLVSETAKVKTDDADPKLQNQHNPDSEQKVKKQRQDNMQRGESSVKDIFESNDEYFKDNAKQL